jgi:hypothetical protein
VLYRLHSTIGPILFAVGLFLTARWGFLISQFENSVEASWFTMFLLGLTVLLVVFATLSAVDVEDTGWGLHLVPVGIGILFILAAAVCVVDIFLSANDAYYSRDVVQQRQLLSPGGFVITAAGAWLSIYGQLGLLPRLEWANREY